MNMVEIKLMGIAKKIKKIRTVKKNKILGSFLYGKLQQKEYSLKLKFMRKGKTQYVKDAINAELDRRYLEKEYRWYLESPKNSYEMDSFFPKIIWWCWFQGYDQAPPLVKACFNSLKRNFPEYKINIITLKNVKNYIDIPEYISKKFEDRTISYAHFSDIVRVFLLAKYGGVWVDSTVYCSNSNIIPIIENTDFFVYQNGLLGNDQDIKISSWFMSAKKNSIFVTEVKQLLEEYWKKHSYLESYFLVHLFFTLVSEKYPEEWKKIPAFNNVSPHMMARELNDKFSQKRYEQLNSFSSMHKLNHHIEFNAQGDTLYRHLLDENNIDLR